jgi:energy-converting hydrogenase Eha subunit C
MDKLLKKDVGRGANHATLNTLWVSGQSDLLHKHNITKIKHNFVKNALIAMIFAPLYSDVHVQSLIIQNIYTILSTCCHKK